MTKLTVLPGRKGKERTYSLVYGLRLYPSENITQVDAGGVQLQDGIQSCVPLHIIEGTRDQIRAQLLTSIDAFFDIYDDENIEMPTPADHQTDEVEETGC